jgi:hypothetical protein
VIEVCKHYSAYPEFTRLEGAQTRPNDSREHIRKKQMTGLCIFASPRLVTLAFANGIRESFRPDEVK